MDEKEKYASQWDNSSHYFYNKGYYSWMSEKLVGYHNVLEIGCGTGYSTLALVNKGFRVLAVDKNSSCIKKAQELLGSASQTSDRAAFIEGDVVEDSFRKTLVEKYSFDVVICWNIGTDWGKEMIQYYLPHMLDYGLDVNSIKDNPESAYSELIIWESCNVAREKGVPLHIVDRSTEILTDKNDPYYLLLKDEFGYSEIVYDNLQASSVSSGGRTLVINGMANTSELVDINFVSVFMR